MKVLFITNDYIIDPLAIAYLSSYLKKQGHTVDLIKAKQENIYTKIEEYNPDVLAYSVTTGMHVYFKDLNSSIKNTFPNLITIVGGAHITFFPDYVKSDGIDYGIAGEGFEAFPELLHCLEVGDNPTGIPNIVTKTFNGKLRPLYNKDLLLLPDRDLIYKYPINRDNPIKNIMTSFGCPFSCPYCYNEKYKKIYDIKMPQQRSVENVIAEVEDLKRFPLELIFFQDDLFPIYNKKWITEFCDKYPKVPFHIQVRLEMITDGVIKQLKSAGLFSVTFAIETGDETLRRDVLNRNMTNSIIFEKVKILQQNDIKYRSENMIGIPNETIQSALKTLDLNIKIKPTIGWASNFQPYPGTALGDQCFSASIFDNDIDSISSSFFEEYILKVAHNKEFNRLQKLFPIIVDKPYLRFLTRLLILLPFDKFYGKLFSFYKKYLYNEKLYKVN